MTGVGRVLAAIAFVAASPSPLHAQPAQRDPRAVAAVRLLELEGPEATGLALEVVGATRDEAALTALLAPALRKDNSELVWGLLDLLKRWPARLDLSLPFVMESFDTLRDHGQVCNAFEALGDAATAQTLEQMSKLRRPAGVTTVKWLECAGAWSSADVAALLDATQRLPLNGWSHVAAPLRIEAASRALSLLTAKGSTLEQKHLALATLGELRAASPQIIDAVDAAIDTAALRHAAATALNSILEAAPAQTLPEARILTLWQSTVPAKLAAQLLVRSEKVAQKVVAQLEASRGCDALTFDRRQPLPSPVQRWVLDELMTPANRLKPCIIEIASSAAKHTPALKPLILPHLPALSQSNKYGEILVELIEAGEGAKLVEQIALHARERSAYGFSEALYRHPLPPAERAALLRALLAPDPTSAGLPKYRDLLTALGPLGRHDMLDLVERSYDQRSLGFDDLRAWAFVATGGDEASYLAAHLRGDAIPTLPAALAAVPHQLALALDILTAKPGLRVTGAALRLLKHHVDNAPWTAADRDRLRAMLDHPALAQPAAGPLRLAISGRLAALSPEPPLAKRVAKYVVGLVGVHFAIWLALLFTLYPRSRLCQSVMLHNPWARKISGLWYTQVLVRAFPSLRRRMFQPLLDADEAKRSHAPDVGFNDQIQLRPALPGQTPQAPQRLGDAIAWTALLDQAGVTVIEGESGVGKSQVLRALLARARAARRTGLLLRAADCADGVTKTIERALELSHADGFVASLLHGGAIELYLDGLNEASPDAVKQITRFCNQARHARIFLTSQPMRWAYPAGAKVWRLLPLAPDQLRAFLLSQWPAIRVDGIDEPAYAARVDAFLGAPPLPQRDPREQEVLRNRYDLAFVAYLLARGQSPDLHALRKQVVDDVASEYAATVPGAAFPLAALGALATKALDGGDPLLDVEALDPVALELLADRKLLLRRGDGAWTFRHESITCYFAAAGVFAPQVTEQAIAKDVLTRERLANPRFRGVYLQLAESQPLPAVEQLALALRDFQREHETITELDREVAAVLDRRRRAITT